MDDRSAITEGVARAHRYFSAVLGAVRHPFTVRVTQTSASGACCGAGYGRIDVNVNDQWQQRQFAELSSSSLAKQVVVAHEYVHVWQADRSCLGTNFPEFVEGLAHYIGHQVLVRDGAFEDRLAHEFQVFAMKNGSSYGEGFAKIEFLTQRTSIAALGRYCEAVGSGIAWPLAFASAFAEDYEAFDAAWRVRRAELLRTAAYPQVGTPTPTSGPATTSTPTLPGPASLVFEGAREPGSVTGAPSHLVPYVFRLTGVEWGSRSLEEQEAAMRVPPGWSGWSGGEQGRIIIFIQPDTPSDVYVFSLVIDGLTLSASFAHTSR